MSSFNQAIKWLIQGKKVRRPMWEEGSYWILGKDNAICWIDKRSAHIHLNQINADDFEVCEEDSLSDKRIDGCHKGRIARAYLEEDIKECFKKIKKRFDNPSGEVHCSVQTLFRIIDKEAGPKLT